MQRVPRKKVFHKIPVLTFDCLTFTDKVLNKINKETYLSSKDQNIYNIHWVLLLRGQTIVRACAPAYVYAGEFPRDPGHV